MASGAWRNIMTAARSANKAYGGKHETSNSAAAAWHRIRALPSLGNQAVWVLFDKPLMRRCVVGVSVLFYGV